MNSPLVSVLIPAFNSERFIAKCVESVLGQNYGRVEVIVVDDGSTDGTREVLEHYKELKVISQTNQGACVARNKALCAADGDYIKFLDADDFLLAEAIALQVDAMKKLDANSMVYGDYIIHREGDVKAINNVVIQQEREQLPQLIMANILTSTPMHRKGLLKKVGGFDARFKSGQEWNLHVRLAAQGARFAYQPVKIYTHRVHFSADRISIKRKNSPSRLEGEVEKILMTLESVGAVSETSLAAFSACLWEIGRAALREGKQDLARSCFELAKTVSHKEMKHFWPTFYRINHALFGVRAAEKISQLTMHFKKSLFY